MWRLFRYYLLKSFPTYKFQFTKENENPIIYSLKVKNSTKEFIIRFSYDKSLNSELFEILLDSLKNQIKENLFSYKKRNKTIKQK